LIGIADTGFKYLLPELGAFVIYALTMVILLWRPRGLFGVFRLARRITVMVGGRILVEGPPEAIAADPEVRRVYLGERRRR